MKPKNKRNSETKLYLKSSLKKLRRTAEKTGKTIGQITNKLIENNNSVTLF
jgi:hypothetical protein